MILDVLAWIALTCAGVPALLFLWNTYLFRSPPQFRDELESPFQISVLIPARNEELSIAACVESVLTSNHVEFEVIVLDDHSDDATARIVNEIVKNDDRVRLEAAPTLLEGWCGKQQACHHLSKLARYPVFTFLDADVRLEPDALARMAAFLSQSRSALVSGFPQQETGTLLEKLVIPLIHWLLLCYLPLIGMRRTRFSAFGAGCGQWFMTTREDYQAVGGHATVKSSLHDGITLPRAYRRKGLKTDICDATEIATCRMYRTNSGVWFGFAKNAREGMASALQIPIWTVLLLTGHVLPFILLPFGNGIAAIGMIAAHVPRVLAAIRFRQSWIGAILHPLGILTLLGIQWYAAWRAIIGKPVEWKGRVTRPTPRRSPDPPSP